MENTAAVGIPFILVLLTSLFVAGTIVTALFDSTTPLDTPDVNRYAHEVVNEISTYLQVKHIAGHYSSTSYDATLTKVALLISPLVSEPVDISMLTIQIQTSTDIYVGTYSGHAEPLGGCGVFSHPLWSTNPVHSSYSCLVTNDKDNSLQDYAQLNDQTDMTYLLVALPESFTLQKGSIFTITLYPGTGIQRTFTVEAPLPMQKIVTLYPYY